MGYYIDLKNISIDKYVEKFKGHIGLHDMKLNVDAAKDVSLDIEN